jgi:hypothetical protein
MTSKQPVDTVASVTASQADTDRSGSSSIRLSMPS